MGRLLHLILRKVHIKKVGEDAWIKELCMIVLPN